MNEYTIFTVFIAEDELPAREKLIDYVMDRPELKLSGIAKNGEEAYQKISSKQYDLLLMDIHLPVLSGIEVLEKLQNLPYIIFTTAYDHYAIKAFDLGAVDYLLKPFSRERFHQAIDQFLKVKDNRKSHLNSVHDLGLSFREKGKHYIVPYQDIIYLSSHSKHTIIHTEERDFETSILLKEVEIKLPVDIFVRIHKQYILNILYVYNIEYNIAGHYTASLKDTDESSLPVGRTFVTSVKKKLNI